MRARPFGHVPGAVLYNPPRMLPGWSRRLPVLRTYEALRVAQERLATVKDELRRTKDERDVMRKLTGYVPSRGQIKDVARTHRESYRSADPFPHVVLDDLFDPRLLKEVLSEFDAIDREPWHYTERETERKYSLEDFHYFVPATRAVITHKEKPKPAPISDLQTAVSKLRQEEAGRDEKFRKQMEEERSRKDVLNKKFDELFKQVKEDPDSLKPRRKEIDWD